LAYLTLKFVVRRILLVRRFLWLAVELVHDGRAGWVRARVVDSFFGK
jgi:hypothetical protein